MHSTDGKDSQVETEINMYLKCAVNLSLTASEATCTSSEIKHLHNARHYLQWHRTEPITVWVAVYLVVVMPRMIIKQNTEIVIPSLFPQCPISFYIFDNTLPCKLPEDRQSNFTQVRKVMGNDIMQQSSCPESVLWFMTTTESGSLQKLGPTLYYLLCAPTQIENKTYSNLRIYSELYKSPLWGFILHSQAMLSERAKWKACGGFVRETSLHHKLSGKRRRRMHTHK